MATASNAISWRQNFDETLKAAQNQPGKEVLLDFSAAPM